MKRIFRHSTALIGLDSVVGNGTKVWAFAHILDGASLGRDCNVCDHTFIEGNVRVGDRVTIKCGVQLWDGVRIGNDCFIGPNATFTNDLRPRSRHHPKEYLRTTVKNGATIGANATILPGLTIGKWAMVGAGAVVTRDVPDFALVVGNPARFRSWICCCGLKLRADGPDFWKCCCGKKFALYRKQKLRLIADTK